MLKILEKWLVFTTFLKNLIGSQPRNVNNCLQNYIIGVYLFPGVVEMGIISRTQIFLSRDFPRGRHEGASRGGSQGRENWSQGRYSAVSTTAGNRLNILYSFGGNY